MTNTKYSMSFTSGTLLYKESVTIAKLYNEMGDWKAVRNTVIADNRLQMRTLNASKRIHREVTSRLKLLTPDQLDLLRNGSLDEQNYLLWLAVCKRYRFIYDFAVEVIRENFLRLDMDLSFEEYEIFFNSKADWHPEIEEVADSTREKQRQVIFKMLREAELLTKNNRILPVLFTPRLIEVIADDDPAQFAVFPLYPADVQEWLS